VPGRARLLFLKEIQKKNRLSARVVFFVQCHYLTVEKYLI
jgi:hypothetical protein